MTMTWALAGLPGGIWQTATFAWPPAKAAVDGTKRAAMKIKAKKLRDKRVVIMADSFKKKKIGLRRKQGTGKIHLDFRGGYLAPMDKS